MHAFDYAEAPARDGVASGRSGNQGHGLTSAASWAAFAGSPPEATPRVAPAPALPSRLLRRMIMGGQVWVS